MRRRLFNALTLLSLLLCAAVCALWLRSYHFSDLLLWKHGRAQGAGWADEETAARSLRGRVIVWRDADVFSPVDPSLVGELRKSNGLHWLRQHPADFDVDLYLDAMVVVPLWAVAAVAAWPVGYWLAMHLLRPELRRRRGLCPACGYDLRASSDRCPECGTAVAKPATSGS